MKNDLQRILNIVSEYYGISENIIKSNNRRKDVAKVRHVYFYIAYLTSDKTYSEVGKFVFRDHSTVLHGHNKIKGEVNLYPDIYFEVLELKEKCKPKINIAIENIDLLQMCINYTNSSIRI